LFRLGLILGWLSSCNSILAILGPWYVVTRLGMNVETDAFFASAALPQFIFLILSATLVHILVPLLATKDEEDFLADARSSFLTITLIFGLIALVLFIFIDLWVPVLVPGFSAAGKDLALELTRIQLISMVLNAGIVTLWSSYYARRNFIWVELSTLVANVAALLLLVDTLPRFGIQAAAWAVVFNNSLKLIFLLPILGRGRRLKWNPSMAAETWRRLKPLLPGQVYLRTDPLVDRHLTSMTSAGGLSLFYIGQQIFSTINQILYKAVASPMTPGLALDAKEGDWEKYRHGVRQRLLMVLALTVSGCLLLLLTGRPILHLAIGHGGVTSENVQTLFLIMLSLSGVLVGGAALQVTSVGFYALGDTRTPTLLSAAIFTIYLPFKVLIFMRYGLTGMAVTMSVYSVTSFLVQSIVLEKAFERRLDQGRRALRETEELATHFR